MLNGWKWTRVAIAVGCRHFILFFCFVLLPQPTSIYACSACTYHCQPNSKWSRTLRAIKKARSWSWSWSWSRWSWELEKCNKEVLMLNWTAEYNFLSCKRFNVLHDNIKSASRQADTQAKWLLEQFVLIITMKKHHAKQRLREYKNLILKST